MKLLLVIDAAKRSFTRHTFAGIVSFGWAMQAFANVRFALVPPILNLSYGGQTRNGHTRTTTRTHASPRTENLNDRYTNAERRSMSACSGQRSAPPHSRSRIEPSESTTASRSHVRTLHHGVVRVDLGSGPPCAAERWMARISDPQVADGRKTPRGVCA